MNPLDLLQKIEDNFTAAAELAATTGADTVEKAAELFDKLGHATRDIAAFLRSGGHVVHPPAPADGGHPAVAAAQPLQVVACCDRLDRLKERCQQAAHPAARGAVGGVGDNPLLKGLLAQLVATAIETVTAWLRQQFPQG